MGGCGVGGCLWSRKRINAPRGATDLQRRNKSYASKQNYSSLSIIRAIIAIKRIIIIST